MTINQMPIETARRILNMIAYGCVNGSGFDSTAYDLLKCRMRGLLPEGEFLCEFEPDEDCLVLSGDDIDASAHHAARRLCK